jgi:hypothetical protein
MTNDLQTMLTYRRKEGSKAERAFCKRYLAPVFGKPDAFGNYILDVGENPELIFAAHYDSVHRKGGRQIVERKGDLLMVAENQPDSNCLGADCATGIWIMLQMIAARVPGRYIVHAAEESGCNGSRYIVEATPELADGIKACISFDRRGTDSIITHQTGYRTASDAFARSFADAIGMDMEPDNGGSFTDSNEYVELIGECTNISVGYYGAHTAKESQDVVFAERLASNLINADWSRLVFERKPGDVESLYNDDVELWGAGYGAMGGDNFDSMTRMIAANPEAVANILEGLGFDSNSLADELFGDIFPQAGRA